jgi:glycosyltransferase involved in cell wall biosynthesis
MSELYDGIPTRRLRVPQLPRGSKIARGVQHFVFGLWLSAAAALLPRADAIVVFSPPLPLPWLVSIVGRIGRIPVAANIQDLFPRQAIELGMLSNPLLIRLFEAMERHMHRLASAVMVHSPGNREHVIRQAGHPDRVYVTYNWVDTERIFPAPRDNDFAREHGLLDRFVVSYAGTMGWAQDMRTIIDAAAQLKEQTDILFHLVGDGVEKEKAQARSQQLGLENIAWLPMQPWSVYPDVLAASDLSLINLHPELHTPVVPSKLLSIMAAGRPVVASLPPESDARRIIDDAGCGIWVEAGDSEALAEAIQQLHSDRDLVKEMGQSGRAYVETHFSREVCVSRVEQVLTTIAEEI